LSIGGPVLWPSGMTPAHLALVLPVMVIRGLAFVATRLALDAFSPPLLTVRSGSWPRPRPRWSSASASGPAGSWAWP